MFLLSRFARPSLLALAGALPLLIAVEARADQACGDSSCPKGFSCETYPTACPDIACDGDDGSCPVCEPGTEQVCVPVPCDSDSDCATDMRCVREERTSCDGGSASCDDAGEGEKPSCVPAAEENCTTRVVSQCVPRWLLPCTTASDCGAGFTCEELDSCSCGGSSGSAGGSDPAPTPEGAEDAPERVPAPDESCSCEPSGEFACVAVETACETDSACAAGWTCEENREGACWSGPEGSGCEPADPAKLCVPPYSDLGGGRGVDLDDGESTGSGSGAPEVPDEAGGSDDESGPTVVTTDRGCAVASPARSGASVAWLGLGLFGLFVSRRRR